MQILTQNSGATHIGSIDEVASPRAGVVRIRGWALDRDDAGASIQVHAYVGGQAGAPNTEGHLFVANGARPEVNSAIDVPGNHGFDATFAVSKSGNVPVCLYGINIGGGSNVLLGCCTVGIADPHPRGSLDEVKALGFAAVKPRGWHLTRVAAAKTSTSTCMWDRNRANREAPRTS